MQGKRKERLMRNTASSLIFQMVTIISGFILPRLILQSFGSEVNGLLNSITQFLQIIAFLELGVGAVVQSSLYKPLVDDDDRTISKIIVSVSRFFKKLAVILLIYVVLLLITYPYIAKNQYDHIYTSILILAIGASFFCQYYFGIVNQLLLTADQKGYIYYNVQTVTIIINTVACVILINLGSSIQIVKLTTALIYLARPIYLRLYVDKHYKIDRKIEYSEEPIKQKWNGVAQHVAAVVLDGTDNIVLTLFASLSDVSIYSVYHLVLFGIKNLYTSMTVGIRSLLGELWARSELEELNKTFGWTEWVIHTGAVLIFGCTGTLILPFISVYTKGITDAEYIQPLFAVLITLAHAGHCIRLPYNMMILAAGHYKQTQSNYIIAALLNVVVSVVTVFKFGLIGVAIGTLAAMGYQTIWMAIYNSNNILRWPFRSFLKQIGVDVLCVAIGVFLTSLLKLRETTYLSWLILAIEHGVIWSGLIILINTILFRDKIKVLFSKFKK